VSASVAAAYRTPEDRFAEVPNFDFEPSFRNVGDLRLAHIDVGEGPPVVMIHGEPSWSFIWRDVIPPIRDAGFRCIAPDHAGFGRSDKPTDPSWHSLEPHVALTATLLEDLDLRDVTLLVHDWGGPVGFTLALAHPDRVARIVTLDTVLDPRETWMSEVWVRFREFVETTEDFPAGQIMQTSCFSELPDEVMAAYDAPFPTTESKAGLTGLPMSVPRVDPDGPPIAEYQDLSEGLRADPRPILILWGQDDLILTVASGERLASGIGRNLDHVIPDAGHGLQEDQGPVVGNLIADWLGSSP
jgi:haloalkane dehalogenase